MGPFLKELQILRGESRIYSRVFMEEPHDQMHVARMTLVVCGARQKVERVEGALGNQKSRL